MKVQLIGATAPLIPGLRTAEDLIVYAARSSNPSNQLNVGTGAKLLRYCIRHGHWSVFETASMTLEIQTSRAIAAQIIRHRSFSFQEFSQRYAEVQHFEPVELRKQAEKNRQSSVEVIESVETSSLLYAAFMSADYVYKELLAAGVARECARMVLPMATGTTLCMTGSCRSWIHYLDLRTKEDTQKEHRLVAEGAKECFKQVFPTVAEALLTEASTNND
jgi:thymidylate synthase (FAD)